MILNHFIVHGLFFAFVVNLYLLVGMVFLNPRIWGYQDYPQVIKDKVSPQTKKEKNIGVFLSIPWFIFIIGFPILSTISLKSKLNGNISLITSVLFIYFLLTLANLIDLIVLDWLIINKITPKFVIISGTEPKDYKDFSHHYKGHLKSFFIFIPICILMAVPITYL